MIRVLKRNTYWLFGGVMIFFLLFGPLLALAQETNSQKAELESQISAIEAEITQLDQELSQVQSRGRTLKSEVERLDNEIKRAELTIRGLNLSIRRAEESIADRVYSIDTAQASIGSQRTSLAEYLRAIYKRDDFSLVEMLLVRKDLAQFFQELGAIENVQQDINKSLEDLKILKARLQEEKEALEDKREELVSLRALAQIQKQNVESQKSEKNKLLKETQGQESAFQKIIKAKKKDIAELRTQVYYLERTGVTAEEALKFATLAANRTGLRPAFLLGLLEVETGRRFQEGTITAGTRTGSGNWQTDLYQCYLNLGKRTAAESQKNAFFQITSRLNYDPDKMPVSRKPSYGCGGAMGPAQFLPSTWLIFESRVTKLTGHNPPDPWKVEDAFTASALYLADSGATSKTPEGELQAARTYISGRPNCRSYICSFYSREVLRVAGLIEEVI